MILQKPPTLFSGSFSITTFSIQIIYLSKDYRRFHWYYRIHFVKDGNNPEKNAEFYSTFVILLLSAHFVVRYFITKILQIWLVVFRSSHLLTDRSLWLNRTNITTTTVEPIIQSIRVRSVTIGYWLNIAQRSHKLQSCFEK